MANAWLTLELWVCVSKLWRPSHDATIRIHDATIHDASMLSGSRLPRVPYPNAQHAANILTARCRPHCGHHLPPLAPTPRTIGTVGLPATRLLVTGLLPLAYTLTHGAAATMLLSPPQGVRSLRCACQAASHGSRQRSGMQQCAHIELALHCARRSFTSFMHHGKLGVHSKRAWRAPGSTGTARLLVVAARRTAALEAVNAVLGPDERLPARPGGRG